MPLLSWLWSDRWRVLTAALGAPAVAGLLVALTLPRGPVTATQALTVVVVGAVVGVTSGLVMRSRWAMLLAPVLYVIVVEVGDPGPRAPRWTASGSLAWP